MAMRPAPEMYNKTQGYSENSTQFNVGNVHGAIDIGTPVGTPLVVPEDSVVVFDGWAWDLPGGPYDYHLRWMLIKPAFGRVKEGPGIITVFENAIGSNWYICHANESFFHKGDRVRKGQIFQISGNTGWSTGPHTHIGLLPKYPNWNNGAFGHIDPEPYLYEKYAPLTHVSWTGTQTEGAGATIVEPKSVLEEIMALDRGSAEYKAVVNDIAEATASKTLYYPVARKGSDPVTGKPYTGNTNLAAEASWGTFRGFRARRIESLLNTVADAVRPSTLLSIFRSSTEV